MRAFDLLHDRFERPLFGFIRAQVGDAGEAEDVLHETFMALLRERPDELRSFRAWVYTVARHLCQNRVRSRKRAGRAHEAAAVTATVPAGAHEQLEAHERGVLLERAVARLPSSLAEVYRLRGAGMSYDEVAEILEVPVTTVRSRVHEMVKRLREEVAS